MKGYYDDFTEPYFRMISSNIKRGSYRLIGKGSGRTVYDLDNGQVVKEARNMRGIAQNFEEYRIALADRSNLFARVYDISDDYRFLIMDKAERIPDISFVWNYFCVESNEELFLISGLRFLSDQYDLLIGDLGRAVNWGKISGRPKIIDYGFTRQVRKKYYQTRHRSR